MIYTYCSFEMGWEGYANYGEVSNDATRWRPVGDNCPIYHILSYTEKGFEAICFDRQVRYFKYFKFKDTEITNISDNDKFHLYRVSY